MARKILAFEDGVIKLLGDGDTCVELDTLAQDATLQEILTALENLEITGGGSGGSSNINPSHETLGLGGEIVVSSIAIEIAPANEERIHLSIQNIGDGICRVGNLDVTTSTGLARLRPGDVLTFNQPFVPDEAIFAIREGATNTTLLVNEGNTPTGWDATDIGWDA